ncbi:Outer membrane efflux protein [Lacunisphaera limnophila]|uniref:Outer membrane efflux protein n=1 Tax=Lacunisphaera limnophila TaxID=1838286 RepID=A0A1D8AT83_9BACT|nr:TolC family protein [Lacunisphaera limnophila]AOS44070.1 Outer membrane efflux protein [Lacunisphaera limnophila]
MQPTRSIICLALLAALPAVGLAQVDIPTGSQADLLRAVTEAPALNAAARRTAAARERIDSSGRLADPELEGMGSRMVGPMNERATMWEVNVRQPLPKRGERAADRDRARAAVLMSEADYALMAGEMAADTAMALAEAQGAEARILLLEAQIARLDPVLRSIESRLATTGGRIADRLTVQSRIAAMQLMIEEERRMAADALAEARGRLGLRPDAPLPAFAAPDVSEINPDNAAIVLLAAARTTEANAMIKMAHASANPMTSVGVRFEQERRAMGNDNTVGIALMTDLPFRSRRYARADVRAAEAERSAAETDATAARYRITAALTRVDRAERLAATARRLSSETLARLNAELDTMLSSASVGTAVMGESTVLQTVELLEMATDTDLQVIRSDTAVRTARAELWRYLPTNRFPNPNRTELP